MAFSIPEDKVDEVLRKTDIVSVVGEYVSLKPQGSEFSGLCPFHNEKTPSFSVSREKGFYYCHGCKEGGSAFNFLMKIDGLSFVEAVRRLADKAGVEISQTGGSPADVIQREKSQKEKAALYELHKRLNDSFHHLLVNTQAGTEAIAYLKGRKINDEMIKLFSLGFALSDKHWLYGFLRKKEYSEEFLAKSGFFSRKYPTYPLFVNRLMFPIFDERDRVVAFSGRAMEESGAKYINSPGTDIFKKGALLFGISKALKTIREKGEFLLCEGNLDVVALHQAGFSNTVAPLGTSYSEEQAAFLKRYCTRGIICFDGDAAGKKATERAGLISMRAGISVKVVQIADGADPADILEKQGEVFLKKIVEKTVNFTDFLLNYKIEGRDLNSVEDREAVLAGLMDYIRTVESQLRLDEIKEKVASGFNVDKNIISMEIDRLLAQGSSQYGGSRRETPGKGSLRVEPVAKVEHSPKRAVSGKPGLQLLLMLNVAINRQFFPMVQRDLGISFFSDNGARFIYEVLDSLSGEETENFQIILEHLRSLSGDDFLGTLLIEKHSSGEFAVNSEEYVVQAIKTVRKNELKRKRIRIDLQLKENEKNGISDKLLEELLLEKSIINTELRLLEEAR